jgi:hypothetical protein
MAWFFDTRANKAAGLPPGVLYCIRALGDNGDVVHRRVRDALPSLPLAVLVLATLLADESGTVRCLPLKFWRTGEESGIPRQPQEHD